MWYRYHFECLAVQSSLANPRDGGKRPLLMTLKMTQLHVTLHWWHICVFRILKQCVLEGTSWFSPFGCLEQKSTPQPTLINVLKLIFNFAN